MKPVQLCSVQSLIDATVTHMHVLCVNAYEDRRRVIIHVETYQS